MMSMVSMSLYGQVILGPPLGTKSGSHSEIGRWVGKKEEA